MTNSSSIEDSRRVFFVLDVNWPKSEWLGHLPSYHIYFVDQLCNAGYKVISLSPDSRRVEQGIAKRCTGSVVKKDIIFLSYSDLENMFNDGLVNNAESLRRKHQGLLFLKKTFKRLVSRKLLELLRKKFKFPNRVNHFLALQEFSKYNKIIKIVAEKYAINLDCISAFFPYVDSLIYFFKFSRNIDSVFDFPWYAVWIQTQFCQGVVKKDTLAFFDCENCKGIGLLEEDKTDKFSNIFPDKNTILLPDIVAKTAIKNECALACHIKSEARGRKIIGLLGRFNDRKGVLNFLRTSLLASSKKLDNYFFVLIGGGQLHDQKTLTLLSQVSENDNTLIYFRSIEKDEDFNAVFNQCDIIYAAYADFPYSSNTLSKAALYKKPVIVSKGYLMQQRVEKYGIGLAVEQDSPQQVLQAIDDIVAKRNNSASLGDIEFEKFSQDFSYKKFGMAVSKLVAM